MDLQLDRHFVWECDYGVRKPVIPVLQRLLREQDASQLQMVSLFVNNNPYNLEFFIVVSYEEPITGQIETMKELMGNAGLRYRPDVTFQELCHEIGGKRFQTVALTHEDQVDELINNCGLFWFADRETVARQVSMNPLGNKMPVFISHATRNTTEVEDLIPFINGAGLPVWFHKISIDYGESLVEAIQKGIKDSAAVIFWITKEFLKSTWCNTELRNFLNRHSERRDVLIMSVISEDVPREHVPLFLKELKYYQRKHQDTPQSIAKEIIPALKKYMDKRCDIDNYF
ncbi:toll/interleukin-1 receptor domain-containing protein [Kyrpidia sp.]|uniref:toll/interleukin-1 receptor domain-containing protein n=1 Tax=Kyrpidia sp. TaxID=2073077 RepID=UPI00258CDD03|nr:toll/interleukin-1 receptor domain-containing protein [Kyrpidia sp.]MCL6577532.1 toll/interleukin-1 receptor domain-containing protein [Kyrpidia sp.]